MPLFLSFVFAAHQLDLFLLFLGEKIIEDCNLNFLIRFYRMRLERYKRFSVKISFNSCHTMPPCEQQYIYIDYSLPS
jgi:hypothetical protein